MMRATLDIVGMYNYDNTLFDLMLIPEQIDKQTLIDNLLMDCAEREIIYSNYSFLKQAIGSWSRKQLPVWQELYDTTQYEYNPIWNKDGTIIELETRDLKATEDVIDNLDRVDNLSDKNIRDSKDKEIRDSKDKNIRDSEDKEIRDIKDESLNSVYGYNSNTDAPANKTEAKGTGTDTIEHTGTDTIEHTGTNTIEHSGSDTVNHTGRQDLDRVIDKDTTDTGTIKHERTEQGNIGLTSTQDLIQQQRDLVLFNLMDKIIEDFGKKFCLSIY